MKPKIVTIIPARGGSKGILRKNIILLNNKPLIAYSIEQSLQSKLVDETYVSTEDYEIKKISLKYGAQVIDRPAELAIDSASTESVILHAMKCLNNKFEFIVLLQPTSPIRYPTQIDDAIKLIIKEKGDSLLSVYKHKCFIWSENAKSINYDYKNRPLRQEKKLEFAENGSIYVTKKKLFLREKNRLGGKIVMYVMPKWMSFEIDDPFDLKLVEYLITTRYSKKL